MPPPSGNGASLGRAIDDPLARNCLSLDLSYPKRGVRSRKTGARRCRGADPARRHGCKRAARRRAPGVPPRTVSFSTFRSPSCERIGILTSVTLQRRQAITRRWYEGCRSWVCAARTRRPTIEMPQRCGDRGVVTLLRGPDQTGTRASVTGVSRSGVTEWTHRRAMPGRCCRASFVTQTIQVMATAMRFACW